jgi:hypothetical protein
MVQSVPTEGNSSNLSKLLIQHAVELLERVRQNIARSPASGQ